MILLVSLELKGFLSHKDTKISFEPQERLLIDGEIGAGKTSIIEAIEWILYEKARNKTVINFDEDKVTGILTLKNGDVFIRITRSLTKDRAGTLSVQESDSIDGKFISIGVSGKKNLQAWIERDFLSCPYELFINSIIYPQHSRESFVSLSASQRKSLLLQMSGLDDLSSYYVKASDEIKKRLTEISSLVVEKQSIDSSLKRLPILEEELEKTKKKLSEAEDTLLQKKTLLDERRALMVPFKSVRNEYKIISDKLLRQRSSLNIIESRISKLNEEKSLKATKQDINSLLSELETIDSQLHKIQKKINESNLLEQEIRLIVSSKPNEIPYADSILKAQEELQKIREEHTSKCILRDECLNFKELLTTKTSYIEEMIKDRSELLFNQEERKKEYTERLEALLQKKIQYESVTIEYSSLLKKKTELEDIKKVFLENEQSYKELLEFNLKRDATFEQIEELEKELIHLEETAFDEKQFESIRQEIEILEKEIQELEVSIRLFSTKIGELGGTMKMITEMKERGILIESSIEEKRSECRKLGYVKDAFGANGIQTIAIELLLPKIERSANEILSQLSDFSIGFETQKSSLDGDTTIEGLFINITNPEGKVSDFSSFSGGERLAITIAISEAFASIQKIGFRVIDELFVGLDAKSIPSFIETLQKIQGRFDQMLCISHLQEVKNEFEKKIYVEKLHGISSVTCV